MLFRFPTISPIIYSDDENALRHQMQGLGTSVGAAEPSGGGAEPSNSTMRVLFGRRPDEEPEIRRVDDTRVDNVTVPMVTSQGENFGAFEKVFQRRQRDERPMSSPAGVGWQPIEGQDIGAAPGAIPMEMDPPTSARQSLANLGVQLTQGMVGRRDGLRSSVGTQYSADAVMQTAAARDWTLKGKRTKTSRSVGSMASADALDAGLNPVDADMPAETLSPPAHERLKKARVERG